MLQSSSAMRLKLSGQIQQRHQQASAVLQGQPAAARICVSHSRKKSTVAPSVWATPSIDPRSTGKEDEEDIDSSTTRLRPQTRMERIKNFPRDVEKLYHHALRYKYIHDASMTPLNAWTVHRPMKANSNTTSQPKETPLSKTPNGILGFLTRNDQPRPGRIPRRQYEQQRQTLEDFKAMLPLVALFLPPLIGYLPAALAVTAPRQILSRQFHNAYEWEIFSRMNYAQRKAVFVELGDFFWSSTILPSPRGRALFQTTRWSDEEGEQEDGAGPLLDPTTLYAAFTDDHPHLSADSHDISKRLLGSVSDLPHDYLVKLSLAIGVNQSLPDWLSPWVSTCSPSWWLATQIERIAEVIVHDDALLLEESHHLSNCSALTDVEVSDACLMRSLPVTKESSMEDRRRCLTNHLKMIATVKDRLQEQQQRKINGICSESQLLPKNFGLFTLHLAPLRYYLKKTLENNHKNNRNQGLFAVE